MSKFWKSLTISLTFGLVSALIVLALPTLVEWVRVLPSVILGWLS